jgi:phosphatidylethanolamine/phosphatidyl-N-methylethanolamine N-methyltransferase
MGNELDQATIDKAYARWAPVYDVVFGPVFYRGRGTAIVAAERIGGRILEVGVGTGISLPEYSRANTIVGIDISEPMLRKARQRVAEQKLHNVEMLSVMDAANLALPDASFDVVVAQYVITAVPDPEGTLDEFARVVKPGGEIILVNHIGAETGMRRKFEQGFAPLARKLGWRAEFRFGRLECWAERHGDISILEHRAVPPLGHFSLIRFKRDGGAAGRRRGVPAGTGYTQMPQPQIP